MAKSPVKDDWEEIEVDDWSEVVEEALPTGSPLQRGLEFLTASNPVMWGTHAITHPDEAGVHLRNMGDITTFGYQPHLSAMASPLVDRAMNPIYKAITGNDAPVAPWAQMVPGTPEYIEARDANIKENSKDDAESPNAATLGKISGIGANMAMPLNKIPGLGPAKSLLGAAGKGFAAGAGLGVLANPGDEIGVYDPLDIDNRIRNAIMGGGLGATIGGGLGLLAKGAHRGEQLIERVSPEPNIGDDVMRGEFQARLQSDDVPRVVGAAERLGVEATPGMKTDNFTKRSLESSLRESDSVAGDKVRATVNKARESLRKAVVDIFGDATDNSRYEIGQMMIQSLSNKMKARLQPLRDAYNQISQSTTNIDLNPKSKAAVARNLRVYAENTYSKNHAGRNLLDNVADGLEGAKTVEHLEQVMTRLENDIAALPGDSQFGFEPILKRLQRMKENAVFRAAAEAAETPAKGKEVAKGLIQQRKVTDKEYAKLNDLVRHIQKVTGIRGDTVAKFVRELEVVEPAEIGEKLFKNTKIDFMNRIRSEFPEVFELVRIQQLNKLLASSKDALDGPVNPRTLLKNFDKLDREVQQMLLNDPMAAQKISDAKTLIKSFPHPANPSRTEIERGNRGFLDPVFQMKEKARYDVYQNDRIPQIRDVTNSAAASSPKSAVAFGRPFAIPPQPLIEGRKMSELEPIDPWMRQQYQSSIQANLEMDSVQKAKLLNLLNKHGVLPREFVEQGM